MEQNIEQTIKQNIEQDIEQNIEQYWYTKGIVKFKNAMPKSLNWEQ